MGYQQGLSGLAASSNDLDVIGNNIANANTVGFKESTAEFADMYANSVSSVINNQIGLGATVASIQQDFSQGTINTTGQALDVAINGNGFFQMSNNGTITYSRNGVFELNKNGNIVDGEGNDLMGYAANTNGVVNTAQTVPLTVPTTNIAPLPTSNIVAQLNLDAQATAPTASPFDATNPDTYSYSTSLTGYDSLGGSEQVNLYFVQTPPSGTGGTGAAEVYAVVNGDTANPQDLGTMTFNSAGQLSGTVEPGTGIVTATTTTTDAAGNVLSTTTSNIANGGTVPATATTTDAAGDTVTTTYALTTPAVATASNGTFVMNVNPTDGAATSTINVDFSGTTQYGGASGVNNLEQDGYASGTLSNFSIGSDGTITGNYSNGQTMVLGQVVLATFNDPNGLVNLGGNQFEATLQSGVAQISAPGSTNHGSLQGGALEESNVDLTNQLVDLITAQRNYQANAQTIKTQQTVDQTLLQM